MWRHQFFFSVLKCSYEILKIKKKFEGHYIYDIIKSRFHRISLSLSIRVDVSIYSRKKDGNEKFIAHQSTVMGALKFKLDLIKDWYLQQLKDILSVMHTTKKKY